MEHTRRGVVGLGRSKDVLAELKAEALHMDAINPINARHAPCTCIETLLHLILSPFFVLMAIDWTLNQNQNIFDCGSSHGFSRIRDLTRARLPMTLLGIWQAPRADLPGLNFHHCSPEKELNLEQIDRHHCHSCSHSLSG